MATFPDLAIVPTHSLVVHEKHDHQRTAALILALKSSGIIRNPPVVAPLDDGTSRYMVLDGANRTIALKNMGIPHVVAQVINPADPGLRLQSWNHIVWEYNPIRLMKNITDIDGIHLLHSKLPVPDPDIYQGPNLALLKNCKSRTYLVKTDHVDLRNRIRVLNELVESYSLRARLDRTLAEDAGALQSVYPSFCGLVVFPELSLHDLFRLSGEGLLLPTGITRFTISPRALHVNFPLTKLASEQDIAIKQDYLREFIQEKVNRKSVRYYAEPTYIFDESNE